MNKEFTLNYVSASTKPIHFNDNLCVGCNRCVDICQCDILFPNEIKGKHPLLIYPGECYYCGACVMVCPFDAIELVHPLMNQAKFVEINEKK
ncbi:MAG: ferredoxin family protein [Traorella sp.]